MAKSGFFLALLSLLFVIAIAEVPAQVAEEGAQDVKETDRSSYYPPPQDKCPCKCWVGRSQGKAARECREYRYKHCNLNRCFVWRRYRKVYGKCCCDDPCPEPPLPACPDKCTTRGKADRDCKHLDHCKVIACDHYHHRQYKCTDDHHDH